MIPAATRRTGSSALGGHLDRLRPADRPRATAGTLRGALWTLLVAVDFFLLSNPLVFLPSFDEALRDTLLVSALVALGTLFWLRVPGVPWVLLAFLGFAALSAAWSQSPGTTWRTVALYALVAAVAVLVAANTSVSVLVDGLTLGGVLIVAASYYALRENLPGAAVPPGIDQGFMAGVGTNRNILAYTLVLALAAAVSVAPKSILGWAARAACVAIMLLNVYLTQSDTGYLAAVAVLAFAVGIGLYDATRLVWVKGLVLTCLLALVVTVALEASTIAHSLGKDGSLSGRVPLWRAIVDVMQDGPLLNGYGWGAVWGHPWSAAPPNAVLARIQKQGKLPAAHGHNSLLDVLPELGLIGVALCALIYLTVAFEAVRLRRRSLPGLGDVATSRFLLVGLVGHLSLGLAEPLSTIPVGWFVLALLVCSKSMADP